MKERVKRNGRVYFRFRVERFLPLRFRVERLRLPPTSLDLFDSGGGRVLRFEFELLLL